MSESSRCPSCGAELAASLLRCPGCGRLVHADELQTLAAEAAARETTGDVLDAIAAWRRALPLLPHDAPQRAVIGARIDALAETPAAKRAKKPGQGKKWAGLAGAGSIVALILSKAKLVLLAFTKLPLLLGLGATVGVYWSMFGWQLGVGFVVSIYIHELGHAVTMQRRGIPVTAIMFVPGLGAVTRGNAPVSSPREANRIGLAGPLWGLGASVAALLLWLATHRDVFAAIAQLSAWLNMLNLIAAPGLDGAHGMQSLTRTQRVLLAVIAGALAIGTRQILTGAVAAAALVRAVATPAPAEPDHLGFANFAGLTAALCALQLVPVPTL